VPGSPRRPPLRVLVTGGPTRAYLDRVRYLSNFSSGELAFELCRELKRRGIAVALVCGPSEFPFESLRLRHLDRVETAEQMRAAVLRRCRGFVPTHAVFAAAVLDFVPARREKGKVSSRARWIVELKPTPKIVDAVGRAFPGTRRFGFKLEWERPGEQAVVRLGRRLLRTKGLEGVCVNYLSEIRGKRHPAVLFLRDGRSLRLRGKRAIARALAAEIAGG